MSGNQNFHNNYKHINGTLSTQENTYYSHLTYRHKLVKYGGSLAFGRWRQEGPKFTARMVRQGVPDCTVLHNKIMSKNLLVFLSFPSFLVHFSFLFSLPSLCSSLLPPLWQCLNQGHQKGKTSSLLLSFAVLRTDMGALCIAGKSRTKELAASLLIYLYYYCQHQVTQESPIHFQLYISKLVFLPCATKLRSMSSQPGPLSDHRIF